jgi:hypothetical protein
MQYKTTQSNSGGIRNLLFLVSGIVVVAIGLMGSSFGSAWSPQVYDFLFGFDAIIYIDTFMPYFPFVPFYPIFAMILGAFLIVKSRGN